MSPLINIQIKRLYDQGATPEQICEAFPNLRPEAVKIILAGMSKDYRKENKDEGFLFSKSDAARVANLTLDMIDDPDCPHAVKAKLMFRVMDESKGRLDVAKDLAKTLGTVNVNLINFHLAQTEQRYRESKQAGNIIDMKPEDQQLLKAE